MLGWMLPFIRQDKGAVGATSVVVNGRYTSQDDMVNLIKSGIADIVGAARPSIADPFLPKKTRKGGWKTPASASVPCRSGPPP